MDERKRNMIYALGVAGITLVGVAAMYFYFIIPIEHYERQKFLDECRELEITCTVSPNPYFIVLGIVPFMAYVATYKFLEDRRIKNWRSYH